MGKTFLAKMGDFLVQGKWVRLSLPETLAVRKKFRFLEQKDLCGQWVKFGENVSTGLTQSKVQVRLDKINYVDNWRNDLGQNEQIFGIM